MSFLKAKGLVFSILGIGSNNMLGVDIGSGAVKMCELSASRGSYKLNKFGVKPLPEGSFFSDEVQKSDEVLATIRELIQEVSPKSPFACIGVWGPNVISKHIQIPLVSKDDLADQVVWEFEQYIPFDVEDATISHHFIKENQGGGADVLVVAAKTEAVERFKGLVEDAGLIAKIIDTNQFAIANIFTHVHGAELEQSERSTLLIDFGASSTSIIIFKGATVFFTRELEIGGRQITDEIQKSMGVGYEEAEGLKIEGDQNGNIPEEIISIIESSLVNFLSEVKKTLNFYMTSSGEDNFHCCYITGGSSLLPGLVENLANELEVEVLFFNPFDRISFNENRFDEDVIAMVSSMGIPALGLAMRELK